MSDTPARAAPKSTLLAAEPQLFVSDLSASFEFYVGKLGFEAAFSYGTPPFYGQVCRDGGRLNLRSVDTPVIDSALREREQLLSASITVDDAQALFLEYRATAVPFAQPLKSEPWGARTFIVRDPDGNLILFAGPGSQGGLMIDPTATIAPTAVLRGDVRVGPKAVIRDGAILIADGGTLSIGESSIVMEHAVIRSTGADDCTIGSHVMIGPHTHLCGCTVEDEVFIATGASVFNGATLRKGSEVRINGVVHIDTFLDLDATVPIGWVAVGNPAQMFPPDRHDEIWAVQKVLNFPQRVFGEPRHSADGISLMRRMIGKYARALRKRSSAE